MQGAGTLNHSQGLSVSTGERRLLQVLPEILIKNLDVADDSH